MFLRVLVFYVMMFLFLLALGGGSQALGLPPELGLAQWGPGIAGLLMLLIFRRDNHQLSFFHRDTPPLRYLAAAAIPPGVVLIAGAIGLLIRVSPDTAAEFGSLWLVILWAPLGALGEEIGWRGYLHRRLDTRMRGFTSSLVVGVLWATMHVHFFGNGLAFMLVFTLMMIAISLVIYAVVRDTGFSILLATLFHLAINLSNLLALGWLNDLTFMAALSGIWVLAAALVVWLRREQFLAAKTPPVPF